MECIRCGVHGEIVPLHDVITGEGIVKLCKRCISEENAPVVNKPTEKEIQCISKSESLYNRLSRVAGINPSEHKRNVQDFKVKDLVKKEEVSLRDLIDKKFDRFIKKDVKKREDLVDNFHWIIMRARRSKKKSVTQLAKDIEEPERVIKMAEQGTLPEGYILIRKLEDALGIRILKPEVAEELERQKKQLGFDKHSTENITISDLHEMKSEEVREAKTPYWRRIVNGLIGKRETVMVDGIEELVPSKKEAQDLKDDEVEIQETPIEFDDNSLEIESDLPKESKGEIKKDLSDKDINDIIFGRK